MAKLMTVSRKEFNSFFASPAAWLFLGMFLIVNLFVVFWGETFFARNIADLKPLFSWMPLLLIFLVAALTMRSWAEERRAGTLESLLTCPINPITLIVGKFFASLSLVALALLLTTPLALTVALLGPLDWGPVLGGYLASLFLAAAYIAIGLYMSGRTDNPIVSLILTVIVAGAFYVLGSSTITTFFGHRIGGILELFGSGSRFDSITRGVFDIRDIYYYLSIVGIFLTLNIFSMERLRWAGNVNQPSHKQWGWLTGLAILNFLLANVWLSTVGWARIDLTQDNIYSLSPATKQLMQQLQEPLLIRGYFSEKSHPLLEPLVPQIKDLLEEYQVAGADKVRVEFVDPHTSQALEEEAAEKYGIHPVPFRMASRYQSGVVNSYFNIVVAYGDQYESLSFEDLIELKAQTNGEPEVLLKNPEYAISQALKKVANTYQAGGDIFANLDSPLSFTAYISPEQQLPEALVELSHELKKVLTEFQQSSEGKFAFQFVDPDADGGAVAQQLAKDYGFGPQIANIFDPKPFWFYMLIKSKGEVVSVPLPSELNSMELKSSIQAAVQRMTPGYLKTVAVVTPPAPQDNPYMAQMGMMPETGNTYRLLLEQLAENVRIKETDLQNGQVSPDTDMLLLLAPDSLNNRQLFAVDQFLMQGGTVLVTTSPFDVEISNSLEANRHQSGLKDWLAHNGLTIEEKMVLDPQNASLPVPVRRNLGPISVNEIQMMPYPHFPDIRNTGLSDQSPMTASLGQLTLNWASPIEVDTDKNKTREVVQLLHSSSKSWLSDSLNVLPDYVKNPDSGFKQEGTPQSYLMALAITGRFDSWFKGKQSPLLEEQAQDSAPADDSTGNSGKEENKQKEKTVVGSIIDHSSDSARIILIASNTFASDSVINLASQGLGSLYTGPFEFIQNGVDWSLGDESLMTIRSRAQFARTLVPMEHRTQLFWEYLNYALAMFGLILVWLWRRMGQRRKQAYYQEILAEV
ncbi:Gldg family protein [Desulforhopalus sp. IMCC35007]|uniref:Gldg family protein n=1 Tax=Desulforhopalus sp. IMCC35007 TaxID=2569543 RepID=UPI0010AE9741|nr:Gldg family protein [Desulforhopalus sp. IMCC35007]TKB05821.1 ABC transporter permease [Desulforhopalus sp. IMCC35007]